MGRKESILEEWPTSHQFLDIIQDEIHQLIITFQNASD